MAINIHRRLTAGRPEDNLPAIVAGIQHDALCVYERTELLVGTLDTRTALGFTLTQALEELASYWPELGLVDEIAEALLALRCELLTSLRGDAEPIEVLRHAAQTIVQLRQDIERLQNDFDREAAELRAEIARRQAAPHYDWSNPPPVLIFQGNDVGGNAILASLASDDDGNEPVGVTVAVLEPEEVG